MSEKTIGTQLDDMGLADDVPPGDRVVEATVTLVTGPEDGAATVHKPVRLPKGEPGSIPVPHPVERRIVTVVSDGQDLSDEQKQRVTAWLRANGIDPSRVTGEISIICKMRGDEVGRQLIAFTEYYVNPSGHKEMNLKTLAGALTFERWVEQSVPLEPDPAWTGWDAWRAQMRAAQATATDAAGGA